MGGYDPNELSKSAAYTILADDRRRILVGILLEDQGEWEVAELTAEYVARTRDTAVDRLTDEMTRRGRIELEHVHLPRLNDHGVISYSHRQPLIVTENSIADLEPLV
ncbi:hypothetical protein ACFPYI_00010 [Halomarina salina]|uniref:DUF7344 domain-containing protein n=1 Tax=Halomarina salina TaxID=1872699 RepID=A0ABD5RHA0_9EURY|nr:hypothetical protein [Halomarina salina]